MINLLLFIHHDDTSLDGYKVVLDHRNLRTPDKNIIQFPKHQRELALLTAAEWDVQTRNLKAHSLPITSIIKL